MSDWCNDDSCIQDVVLSDVHLYTTFTPTEEGLEGNYALSRFSFTIPQSNCQTTHEQNLSRKEKNIVAETDEDGDILVRRLQQNEIEQNVITIEHSLATSISSVGTQVWRGSLLLCDFLLHHEKEFDGCIALELGGGVGLCSIVMARVAKRVFCTDIIDVLKICEANKLRNCDLFKYSTSDNAVMMVKELDFFHSSRVLDGMDRGHGWTKEDRSDLRRLSVIIASDVIYDDSLTDAFLKTVEKLFDLNPNAVLYISLEKRINFTLQALEVISPAYDYFMTKLKEISERVESRMNVQKLATKFPQYFMYDRVKQLELWKIHRHMDVHQAHCCSDI